MGLLAALRQLNPLDWHRRYSEWFALMTACKFAGIGVEDFVEWSIGDPYYAKDAQRIRRMWRDCEPSHGGALWKALAERGIRVRTGAGGLSVINEVPISAEIQRSPTSTIPIGPRVNLTLDWFDRQPTEQRLFNAACMLAEIISEGKFKPSMATDLLMGRCFLKRWLGIGKDECIRTVSNGLRHVEEKLLARERKP